MKRTTLKVSEIKNNPNNPRLIKDDKFKKLVQSIKDFPEMLNAREIVVNKDHVILGGNMRFKAAKEAGLKEVPVKIVDWDEDKQRQFIIKDNVSGGEWDWDLLANEWNVDELNDWGLDLPDDWLEQEPEIVEDEVPEVSDEPPVSKLGEVYQLGRHRVMCGDSTDNADISKLLSGAEIELLLTDPPYNLGFSYNQYDDNKTLEEYEKLLSKAIYDIDVPKKIVTPGKQNLFSAYKLSRVTDVAIWYSKNKMSGGKISNLSLWEPLVFIGDFDRNTRATDVLEYTNEKQKDTGDHTCPKTVKLFTELLKYSSTNSNVLDTFIGSGTTLIACEQTGRTCFGMEIDPKYVDVIRKRYWKFVTGSEEGWQDGTKAI